MHREHSRSLRFLSGLLCYGLVLQPLVPGAALAAPENPVVQEGTAIFETVGDITTITASDRAIIDYTGFNIGSTETVQFVQPSELAAVMNRISSASPTQIDGSLLANGQVYIVNPAGVIFGADAVVDVARLVAASGTISNADFLAGVDQFTDLAGTVENQGQIDAARTELIGRHVENSGIVTSDDLIVMAAGDDVFIGELNGSVFVRIEGGATQDPGTPGIVNSGSLDTPGGVLSLAVGDVYALAIDHSGSAVGNEIQIAGSENGGLVDLSGSLDGGTIDVAAADIGALGSMTSTGDVTLDESGTTGIALGTIDAGAGDVTVSSGGAVSGAAPGTHITTTGDVSLTGTAIGSDATPIGIDGGGTSDSRLAVDASGDVDVAVTQEGFSAVAVTQRDAEGDVDVSQDDPVSDDVIEIDGAPGASTIVNVDTDNLAFAYQLADTNADRVVVQTGTMTLGGDTVIQNLGDVQVGTAVGTAIEAEGFDLTLVADSDADGDGAIVDGVAGAAGATIDMRSTAPGSGELLLLAGDGIGAAGDAILTENLGNVAAQTDTGDVFVTNAAGGTVTVAAVENGGATPGTFSHTGIVATTGGVELVNDGGSIALNEVVRGATSVTLDASADITDGGGSVQGDADGADVSLVAGGNIGAAPPDAIDVRNVDTLTLSTPQNAFVRQTADDDALLTLAANLSGTDTLDIRTDVGELALAGTQLAETQAVLGAATSITAAPGAAITGDAGGSDVTLQAGTDVGTSVAPIELQRVDTLRLTATSGSGFVRQLTDNDGVMALGDSAAGGTLLVDNTSGNLSVAGEVRAGTLVTLDALTISDGGGSVGGDALDGADVTLVAITDVGSSVAPIELVNVDTLRLTAPAPGSDAFVQQTADDDATLALGDSSVGGTLSAINDSGDIAVTGTATAGTLASLDAAGAIVGAGGTVGGDALDGADVTLVAGTDAGTSGSPVGVANVDTLRVTLTSGSAFVRQAADDDASMAVGTSTASGTLSVVNDDGDIAVAGTLTGGTLATLDASGAITDAGGTVGGDATNGANVTLIAGTDVGTLVDPIEVVNVDTLRVTAGTSAADDAFVHQAADDDATLAFGDSTTGGTLSVVNENGSISVAGTARAGTLATLDAGVAITDGGGSVGGDAVDGADVTLVAGTDVGTLADPVELANVDTLRVNLTSGSAFTHQAADDDASMALGTSTASGTFSVVNDDGDLAVAGTVTAGAQATLDASGAITDAGGTVGGDATNGANVTLIAGTEIGTPADAIEVVNVDTLRVTAGGTAADDAFVHQATDDDTALAVGDSTAGGVLSVVNDDGDLSVAGTITAGSFASLDASGAITDGGGTVGGDADGANVALIAGTNVGAAAADRIELRNVDTLSGSAGGSFFALQTADDDTSMSLGLITATTTLEIENDAGNLAIGGPVSAGTAARLDASGAITDANGSISGDANGADLTLIAAQNVGAAGPDQVEVRNVDTLTVSAGTNAFVRQTLDDDASVGLATSSATAGALDIENDAGSLAVNGTLTGGTAVRLDASAAITDGGGVVSGDANGANVTLIAGTNVGAASPNQIEVRNVDTLAVSAGGNAFVHQATDNNASMSLGTGTVTGSLDVENDAGDLAIAGTATAGTSVRLDASGAITDGGGTVGGDAVDGANVTLIAATSIGAAAPSQVEVVNVDTLTLSAPTNAFVRQGADDDTALSLTATTVTGTLDVENADGGIALAGSQTAGTLVELTASTSLTDAAGVFVGGDADGADVTLIASTGSIGVDDGNQIDVRNVDTLSLTAGANAFVNQASDDDAQITLGASNAGGTLDLENVAPGGGIVVADNGVDGSLVLDTPGTIEFTVPAVTAGQNILLNTDPAVAPPLPQQLATIFVRPGPGNTPSNLALTAQNGSFRMGAGQKLSVPGHLIIDATNAGNTGTAEVGDLSALELTINADNANVIRRNAGTVFLADGSLQSDSGVDLAANTMVLNLDAPMTVTGAGGAFPIIATAAGSAVVNAPAASTIGRLFQDGGSLTAADFVGNAGTPIAGQILDRAPGAIIVTGSTNAPIPVPEEVLIGSGLLNQLNQIAAAEKPPWTKEILDEIECSLYEGEDASAVPAECRGASGSGAAPDPRMQNDAIVEAKQIYVDLLSDVVTLKDSLQTAADSYRARTPQAQISGPGFRSYLEESPEQAQALAYVRKLGDLFDKLEQMPGGSDQAAELQSWRGRLLEEITPNGMNPTELEEAIRARGTAEGPPMLAVSDLPTLPR